MSPRLDVVIVSFNTRNDLLRCLESLYEQPPAALGCVIVVDNGSSDGSVEAVRQQWPAAAVVPMGRNAGFAAANNAGIRRATADLVLLLNSDTIVPAGALDALAGRLTATGAVAAGPALVGEDGRPEISFGPMLSPLAEARQRLRGRLARREGRVARWYVGRLVARERFVDWVSGACLLVRREAALAAGLLDERFFMYEEDVDFCAALRRTGGRVLFTPAARIVHLGGRSWLHAALAARPAYDRSHLAFYEKHAPRWAPWLRFWLRLRGRAIR
jgi:GT2 family glycosyltransferase